MLLLHGAGGHAQQGLNLLLHLSDETGMILVAPASTAHIWDVVINHVYGADVSLLDQALAHVFAHYAVDTAHRALGGRRTGS